MVITLYQFHNQADSALFFDFLKTSLVSIVWIQESQYQQPFWHEYQMLD